MKRYAKFMLVAGLVLSGNAFGWGGNGHRPAEDPKIPTDTDHAGKVDAADGSSVVEVDFSNRTGSKNLLCDIMASVDAKRGSDTVTLTAYVDRRLVKAYRGFKDRFVFDGQEAGEGYVFQKVTQKYEPSCLSLDTNEDPGQVPNPHTKCDPEWEDCDYGCKSVGQNPDQCDNPSQDWPTGN